MNQDDSHSWIRISFGTVKYVNDSIEDDTEIPADPQEEQVSQTSTNVNAVRTNAKAKPHSRESTDTTTIPLSERVWIDIEPAKPDLESYNLSENSPHGASDHIYFPFNDSIVQRKVEK